MKTIFKITLLFLMINAFQSCAKDDAPPLEPVVKAEPEPENLPPSSFSIDVTTKKNTAQISWAAPTDPEGDTILYKIMLGDSLVTEQSETNIEFSSLLFEQEYQGKIIADDGNENQIEVVFNFTTGILWLTQYESNNGSGNGYAYEYDISEALSAIVFTRTNERSNISYDNEGRLLSFKDISYNYNNNGLLTSISDGSGLGDIELLYDDEDKIRVLNLTRNEPDRQNYISRVKIDFFYNDAGDLVIMNRERRYSRVNTDGNVFQFNRQRLVYDTSGNVVESISEDSDDGVTYTESNKFVMTYDDKKNPLTNIIEKQIKIDFQLLLGLTNVFDPLNFSYLQIEGYRFALNRGVHNIKSQKFFSGEDLLLGYDYEYNYNASGYPISARAVDNEGKETFPRWTYADGQ
ncbi:hypothetical protein FGM00_15505 [Aggregatimonas sangjinii]|uniref:Fibronectin type-III domain-containing protein n=1 Tax=Aggregatimonas sangjinii TaxID=2583587 RepID=A0A5B7SXE6_9FLAO|nr:fibronectin type III domain-containing protein [Aggregatimonas sangjinii]QCX01444.1 hypothetical protein FGM00_15505 [Aggregatimonas sangjinii]